jgi:hypothetical protein
MQDVALLSRHVSGAAPRRAYPGRSVPILWKSVMMASSTTRSVASSSRMSRTSCSVGMLSLSAYFCWSDADLLPRSAPYPLG